jgi:hypothetical protein
MLDLEISASQVLAERFNRGTIEAVASQQQPSGAPRYRQPATTALEKRNGVTGSADKQVTTLASGSNEAGSGLEP